MMCTKKKKKKEVEKNRLCLIHREENNCCRNNIRFFLNSLKIANLSQMGSRFRATEDARCPYDIPSRQEGKLWIWICLIWINTAIINTENNEFLHTSSPQSNEQTLLTVTPITNMTWYTLHSQTTTKEFPCCHPLPPSSLFFPGILGLLLLLRLHIPDNFFCLSSS